VYVMIIVISCLSGIYGQFFLVLFLTTSATIEWMQFRKEKSISLSVALITGIILLLVYGYSGIYPIEENQLVLIKALIFLLTISLMMSHAFTEKHKNNIPRLLHATSALIYIGIPMFLITLTPIYKGERINWILLSVFILIWSGDTFAYLSGRILGKHKFFERISPKKTWEGFIGGFVFAMITAYVLSLYFQFFSLPAWLGLGVVVFLLSTTGDLFESAVKRYFKVKDSGKFMPGHGGILDRIDSLLFALPAAYFYLRILEKFNL